MPLSTITHYSATTSGVKGPDADGRRKHVGIMNLDTALTLKYWLLSETEAKAGVPDPATKATSYKEIGPGKERTWDGDACPENTLYFEGVSGTVKTAVEIKLGAGA